MTIDNEFEIRMQMEGEGNRYFTDLDYRTLKRADDVRTSNQIEALHNGTEVVPKGPWTPGIEVDRLMI